MEEIPHKQSRVNHRAKTPWKKITFICFSLPALLFCLFPLFLRLGFGVQVAIDHMRGPLPIESAVSATAPDGKTRFEAEPDGKVRLVMPYKKQLLQWRRISPQEYRRIEAKWTSNREVVLTCYLRYPAQLLYREYFWDSKTGAFKDR